ncbi:unnamed protein product [Closterium sp. Yama58-4]|nr:unnamed protein product [Closterium sp. Yama58-4]
MDPVHRKLRLNGAVVKVQQAETAGEMGKITVDVKERADELEAQVKKQGEAMAALKREVDEMRRALAKGALELMRAGDDHDAGGAAAGKDADGLPAQPPPPQKGEALMALVEAMIAARVKDVRDELESQVRGLKEQLEAAKVCFKTSQNTFKEQLEAAKGEARGAASEVKAMVNRQAAEIAEVKATAAHIDARMNDVELAAAEWKDAPREKDAPRAERSDADASAREQAGAEGREGKRRKREEAGKGDEMAQPGGSPDAAACGGALPALESSASIQKRDAADDTKWEVERQELKGRVDSLACKVAKLEKTSGEGKMIWEAMLTLWAAAAPDQTQMDLSGISCLTDAALTRLTSLHSLTPLNLRGSSGFTAAGMRKLYSLKGLLRLELGTPGVTNAALEGIGQLKSLSVFIANHTRITDAGVARLQELSALTALCIAGCASVTSASMVDVGKMTALEWLTLNGSGVTEDGLEHLTGLTSLKYFMLPPGVTDSGIKHLRNMKLLEKLSLRDASITASGMKWLKGLKCLQKVATDSYEVEELIRDMLPGVIVTSGPLNA